MVMKFWNWYGGMHRQRFFCFAFLFISLQYLMFCYATFYFSTDTFHIILPIFSFFFFPFSLLLYKKNYKKKKKKSDGVKRSQTDPMVTKYQRSTSTSLHFSEWN